VSAVDAIAAARIAVLRISVAESSAGGLISAALTAVPGASAVFDRGLVAYSDSAKQVMLGVLPETLERVGAVSEEVAREMADGMLRRSDADITVAETGITGPGGSQVKPEGRCCFALARVGEDTVTGTMDFGPLGRDKVREAIRDHALWMLAEALAESS
jgi:nicotinamide-nucleotide amidase